MHSVAMEIKTCLYDHVFFFFFRDLGITFLHYWIYIRAVTYVIFMLHIASTKPERRSTSRRNGKRGRNLMIDRIYKPRSLLYHCFMIVPQLCPIIYCIIHKVISCDCSIPVIFSGLEQGHLKPSQSCMSPLATVDDKQHSFLVKNG